MSSRAPSASSPLSHRLRRICPALLIAALLSVSAAPVATQTIALPSGAPPASVAGSLPALAGVENAGDRFVRGQGREPGRGRNRTGPANGDEFTWTALAIWLVPFLLIFGLINLVRGFKARRRFTSFAGGVTPVRDLEDGTAMVTGTVEAPEYLESPITESPCVHFEFRIDEDYHRTSVKRVKQTVSDFDGNRYGGMGGYTGSRDVWSDEVKHDYGTQKVGNGSRAVPFTIDDGTGKLVVLSDRADFVGVTTCDEKVNDRDPRYAVRGVPGTAGSTGKRHLREAIVPLGAVVTVIGPVETENGAPQMRWTRTLGPSAKNRFLITVEDPSRAERSERREMIRRFVRATVQLALAIVIVALNAEWTGPGA